MLMKRFAVTGLLAFGLLSAPASALAQTDAMALCKSDVARLCPGVEPGGGRIVQCLKAHKMEMSVGCAEAMQTMKAQMGK